MLEKLLLSLYCIYCNLEGLVSLSHFAPTWEGLTSLSHNSLMLLDFILVFVHTRKEWGLPLNHFYAKPKRLTCSAWQFKSAFVPFSFPSWEGGKAYWNHFYTKPNRGCSPQPSYFTWQLLFAVHILTLLFILGKKWGLYWAIPTPSIYLAALTILTTILTSLFLGCCNQFT